MSGRESGRTPPGLPEGVINPDTAEIVPGIKRQQVQGLVPGLATPEEVQSALEGAFDYRGDVAIIRKDGSEIEGYVFDRRAGKSLADSYVRLLPKDGSPKVSVCYADIATLAFTGRDMAAGKSWENWVTSYWQRKAAGESEISLQPEELE